MNAMWIDCSANRPVPGTHRSVGRSRTNLAETMQNMPLEEYMSQATAEPLPSKRSRAIEEEE
jgi:hypothetical protein